MALTFDDLVTPPTQSEAFDGVIVPELQAREIPTTDWGAGDPVRVMALVMARLHAEGRGALATLAAAGFEDYAFGVTDPPGGIEIPDSWATLIAKQRYNLDRIAATYTTRTIRFTNATASAHGPYSKGDLVVEFADYEGPDNRYVLDEDGVTIAAGPGVSTDLVFRSEYTINAAEGYAYNHASGTTVRLVTASLPGVTATNPAGTFTATALAGTSEGTVTPSGVPAGLAATSSWEVNITATGQAAACSWRYRYRDSAGTLSVWAPVVASATAAPGGTGITITLANDSGGVNPSFIAGDTFRFSTPGTDVVTAGRDQETRQALGIRCRGIWPSLSFAKNADGDALPRSVTRAAYDTLVRSASDQVVHTLIETDATINGRVNVYVAGQGSALAPATLTALQSFMDSVSDLTDYVVVDSPTKRAITIGPGVTVYVAAGMLATAQAEMQDRLDAYFTGTDTGNPIGLNPRIDRAYLIELIRGTRGVTRTDADITLTINGAATDLQLPIAPGAVELATWAQSVASVFVWSVA